MTLKSSRGVKRRTFDVIRVFRAPGGGQRGRLRAGRIEIPCALGRNGTASRKREGDRGTPVGRMRVLAAYYRPDRIRRPSTLLPLSPIGPADGWCDDPASRLYNRPVRLPMPARHERLWREDALYDLVLDLGWNRHPAVRGRGSAIFLHVARPGLSATEGCVAVHPQTIGRLIGWIGPGTVVDVMSGPRKRRRRPKHEGVARRP